MNRPHNVSFVDNTDDWEPNMCADDTYASADDAPRAMSESKPMIDYGIIPKSVEPVEME